MAACVHIYKYKQNIYIYNQKEKEKINIFIRSLKWKSTNIHKIDKMGSYCRRENTNRGESML